MINVDLKKVFLFWVIPICSIVFITTIVAHAFTTEPILKEWDWHWSQRVSTYIRGYVTTWSLVITGLVTFLLVYAAFWSIVEGRSARREDKRLVLINEIRLWAENVIVAITDPRISIAYPLFRADMQLLLRPLNARSLGILADVEQIGGDLQKIVRVAVRRLTAVDKVVVNPNKKFRLDRVKRILIIAFTAVINTTSEYRDPLK